MVTQSVPFIYSNMITNLKIRFFILFTIIIFYLIYQNNQIEKYKNLYSIESNNYKSSINDKIVLKLSIDQLRYQQDSILHKMDSVIKLSNIKYKNLIGISYIKEVIIRYDTLRLKDTVFQKDIDIDTIIGDKWYSLKLSLKYPSEIIIIPSFLNEKYIISSIKKKYIKPKKKWPLYWFQSKQLIEEVIIKDSNPYIQNNEVKYVKIIK